MLSGRRPGPLAPARSMPRAGAGLGLRSLGGQAAAPCGNRPAHPKAAEDSAPGKPPATPFWAEGRYDTPAGTVLRAKTAPGFRDRLDLVRSRLVRRRERIRVEPGLYALGTPGAATRVFVTANYKPSFDALRFALSGRDAWLLALDTKGVNVWCAAGKGSFGDAELVARIRRARLDRIAPRAELVLPQLGATGVSAWKVARATGRKVRVGPVRAADLGAWLDAGLVASAEMRRVRFGLCERAALVPRELVAWLGAFALALLPALAFAWAAGRGAPSGSAERTFRALVARTLSWWTAPVGGLLAGLVAFPLLLPWLPFRRFSLKGALLGAAWAAAWLAAVRLPALESAAGALAATGLASFVAVEFTGSSTYTSQGAVKDELKLALPLQIAALVLAALALAARLALAFLGVGGRQ